MPNFVYSNVLENEKWVDVKNQSMCKCPIKFRVTVYWYTCMYWYTCIYVVKELLGRKFICPNFKARWNKFCVSCFLTDPLKEDRP